jgi:ubiquitin-conjugating enzyme E2 variant
MSSLLVEGVATVLLADFVSGFVHWAEDAYARPATPLLGRIAQDNLRHHWRPREFLARSWLQSSWDLVLGGALVINAAAATGWLSWHVVLFAVLVANANQIHKWAHMNRSELPWIVGVLQRLYLLQNARHHGRHHAGTRTTHYCVITNFLNPLLEEVSLWSRLEAAIERWVGFRRRNEAEELALLGLPARRTTPKACSQCVLQAG